MNKLCLQKYEHLTYWLPLNYIYYSTKKGGNVNSSFIRVYFALSVELILTHSRVQWPLDARHF